ncbi:translation initiation factor IF-3 [Candidatus Woesebacteria bacterium RIFCSPHIGHO2_02_FULL_38_9]|uniref:Translation initiation factor IF-3 n=1 Tax=Candidatus Woesebacteria bacterium RIFCSPHIGHO2_01_FULL_39_28 TaxID=1802496 RepID=A0A1F7YCX2_9BACT|nr:MAG: translation initiation factor IF-3 [Candidatus Woesebacteria bacterium RIFCSPHIGHO2_01_FULL_39_28]OGM32402.1 MAG: translation initiation factor IF-3 [Candidatus Woesebacteria bacterium RIFCSPHIGHO2_02_FULL_38_9]OGM57899.1 MAG: translation initiation factor IF-3 [Candidatus Woesebacteria bacterium RIFCSPLOWO2_01_FULL_38_20]
MRTIKTNYRVNSQIRAPKLRVIGSEGKQVGIISLNDALKTANDAKLDLVEIAPNAKPPVAKIVELSKFLYQEEKRVKKLQKQAKASILKEIRLSPFIAENDYNVRIERIKEFLVEKNKVKATVVFKGRQMGSKQFGYDLLNKILRTLGDSVALDMKPKFYGRHLSMIVSPLKSKISSLEGRKDA